MTIGERIKKLRKERDLTQEKLAEILGVTTQAVSKWECSLSNPDLSLMGPLTRLLGVTADELLGLDRKTADARRKEIDDAYKNTFRTGDLEERCRILEAAAAEYPDDMEILVNFAWAVGNRSYSFKDNESFNEQQERAIRLFERAAEDCADRKLRDEAVHGLCQHLWSQGRLEEAKRAAQLYSGDPGDLAVYLLTGEELAAHKQKCLEYTFNDLFSGLNCLPVMKDPRAADAAVTIIYAMLPDGPYLWYDYTLATARLCQAKRAVREGKYDEAVELLGKMKEHCAAYDETHWIHPGVYRFSGPFLNLVEVDTRECAHTNDFPLLDGLADDLADPVFDPLREREDFRALTS